MNLDHVVVTSVTRDDLPDGGAVLFANTIRELRKMNPDLSVEVLIPDFQGNPDSLKIVLDATPDVLNHNIETVPRLYKEVRPEADYHRSLWLLNRAAATSPATVTKSGIMLGLGEGDEEIEKTIQDVYHAGCRILTIGQYLQPSKQHLEVRRYIHPGEFNMWRERALDAGFTGVASGPFVRSSYHARQMFLDAGKKDTNENTGH
jgi:lipoic acid synthetase